MLSQQEALAHPGMHCCRHSATPVPACSTERVLTTVTYGFCITIAGTRAAFCSASTGTAARLTSSTENVPYPRYSLGAVSRGVKLPVTAEKSVITVKVIVITVNGKIKVILR